MSGSARAPASSGGTSRLRTNELLARRTCGPSRAEVRGHDAADVDFIVVGTTTPDLIFPNTGTLLQQRLDIHGCTAFSLETACSGFVYALSIADKSCGSANRSARSWSASSAVAFVDCTDRGTPCCSATARCGHPDAVRRAGNHRHAPALGGKYQDLLYFPYGVSSGFDKLRNNSTDGLKMHGNEVFKVAVRTLSKLVDETLAKNGVERSEIDWLVPHQANLRIIQSAADKLGLPMEKVVVTVQDQPNPPPRFRLPRHGRARRAHPPAVALLERSAALYLGFGVYANVRKRCGQASA